VRQLLAGEDMSTEVEESVLLGAKQRRLHAFCSDWLSVKIVLAL
jgi:hypothetical protein